MTQFLFPEGQKIIYEYYAKWFGRGVPEIIRGLQGQVLNSASRQSELAPALLEKIKLVLQDRWYVARLKRHYKMFKATVDGAGPEPVGKGSTASEVGRNDPCPCGSGK